jgi:uncharacterized protein YwqG
MEAEKLAEQNNNRDERQQALADAGGARPNDKNFIPVMTQRANEFFGPGGFDKVIAALNGLAKEAHEISIGKAVEDLGLTESHLCGAPYGEANQGWPHCGECSKSMTFVGQLNTGMIEDFPESGPGLYTIFVCFACNHAANESPAPPGNGWLVRTYTTVSNGSRIRPPRGTKETPARPMKTNDTVKTLPQWDFVDKLDPDFVDTLVRLYPPDVESLYEKLQAVALGPDHEAAFSHVGGYPEWLGGEEIVLCKKCQSPLSLLLQLESIESLGLKFGDEGIAYLMYCPNHPADTSLVVQGA